ncbi:hypothetical protein JJQ72_15390 [Paenibacillus sp. F411]|uniref:hypothetical protein n=1 Tax=Paenibacillus sp. F411 TaxID=2820239 RepID=UPI001AAE2E9C|nr:hypothetical protein [Paenibacillus sp. F411]MBO2945359.1 hypothetical protein [Paenibacillus sp. F411]
MKKMIGLLLVMVLVMPINAFAAEVNNMSPKVEAPEDFALLNEYNLIEGQYVCVDDTQAVVSVNQIDPLATCSGSGGYARINSAFGPGGAISWEVNPRFSTLHTFSGAIVVYKYYGVLPVLNDTIPVSCTGALGGACGDDYVPLGLSSGSYSISLTGTARDASGLFSWVVPPCEIGLSI